MLLTGAIPRSPNQMSPSQPESADSGNSTDGGSDEESAAAWTAMNLPDMDDATRQLILDSIRANAASDEEEDEDDIRQMLSDQPTNDATAEADDSAMHLQAESFNLVEDLPAVVEESRFRTPIRKLDSDSLEGYDQWDQQYWQNNMPEAVDATVAAAQIWSRIIRTPRKRGKHIIIDVCSPREHSNDSGAVDTAHGHLVRQVVATTDKKTWLGPGGYRLARKSRWGDLWPKYYQDYALTHKLGNEPQ